MGRIFCEFVVRQKSCGFSTKMFSACWRYKPGFYFFSLHKINFINKLGKMFSIALTKTRNDLKRPTMSKKWSETTYNVQERTWNDLGQPRGRKTWCDLLWARNNLKQSTTSKGQPDDLHQTDSKFMEPLYLQNNELEASNATKKQQIISVVEIFCLSCAYERKIKANVRTKQSKATKHWIIVWLGSTLVQLSRFCK